MKNVFRLGPIEIIDTDFSDNISSTPLDNDTDDSNIRRLHIVTDVVSVCVRAMAFIATSISNRVVIILVVSENDTKLYKINCAKS